MNFWEISSTSRRPLLVSFSMCLSAMSSATPNAARWALCERVSIVVAIIQTPSFLKCCVFYRSTGSARRFPQIQHSGLRSRSGKSFFTPLAIYCIINQPFVQSFYAQTGRKSEFCCFFAAKRWDFVLFLPFRRKACCAICTSTAFCPKTLCSERVCKRGKGGNVKITKGLNFLLLCGLGGVIHCRE